MVRRLTVLLLLLPLLLTLNGCIPEEQVAYKTVIASKAFLDSLKVGHPECGPGITASTPFCSNLRTAIAAKDLIIDAVEVYCSGPQFNTGGACNPPKKGTPGYTQALVKLQTALANYEQIEKDLKQAYSLKGAH
jgi:hypothetical protein